MESVSHNDMDEPDVSLKAFMCPNHHNIQNWFRTTVWKAYFLRLSYTPLGSSKIAFGNSFRRSLTVKKNLHAIYVFSNMQTLIQTAGIQGISEKEGEMELTQRFPKQHGS